MHDDVEGMPCQLASVDGSIDPSVWALASVLGAGRIAYNETSEWHVAYGNAGGMGIRIDAHWQGAPVALWCDSAAWCEWIAPVLPVPGFDAIPADLLPVLAAWTLAGVFGEADAGQFVSGLQGHGVTMADAPVRQRVAITGQRADQQLTLHWLDGPLAPLRDCLVEMMPMEASPPSVMCLWAAGWVWLTPSQCDALHVGEGLLLDDAADIDAGQCWCVHHARAALVQWPQENGDALIPLGEVQSMVTWNGPDADNSDGDEGALTSGAMTRILAVVGQAPMPLPEVAGWKAGVRVSLPTLPGGPVTLWRDGRAWAVGRLAAFEDRLVVRIENFVAFGVLA